METKERLGFFSKFVKNGTGFYDKIDWLAFWLATATAFLVYFFTLGPSVGLEDSGELTVAANSLGVPHPPGYPIWTIISWLFCRVFQFVTFRGMPNPAWCVALASAVAGAFTAGITAMLITKSGRDMMSNSTVKRNSTSTAWICLSAGIGASLAFAFSPVMWSQSVIVEVYALGALFMMWVLLLSYQWMRKPENKTLWLLAFVFGLGLTNYQVLLLAVLPLGVMILFGNSKLFRDFVLIALPIGFTAYFLSLGALPTADMSSTEGFPVIVRSLPKMVSLPNQPLLFTGVAIMLCGFLGIAWREHVAKCPNPCVICKSCSKFLNLPCALPFAGLSFIGALFMIFSTVSNKATETKLLFPSDIPLINPLFYILLSIMLLGLVTLLLSVIRKEKITDSPIAFISAIVVTIAIFMTLFMIPTPQLQDPKHFNGTLQNFKPVGMILLAALSFIWAFSYKKTATVVYAWITSVVLTSILVLVAKGALLGLEDPATWWFWWVPIWNFVLLIIAGFCLTNGKTVSVSVLLAQLGVSFYAYMPISSETNPPMNWGYPRTWDGFKHALSRGQYEAISPANIFSHTFIDQLLAYCKDVRIQFTLLVAPLAFIPFTNWRIKKFRIIDVAIAVFAICSIFVFGAELLNDEPFMRIDMGLIGILAILGSIGLVVLLLRAFNLIKKENSYLGFETDRTTAQWLIGTFLFFLVMSVMLIALANPRGDIQDGFIQKVKFISSHGVLGLWLGYGLIAVMARIFDKLSFKFIRTGMYVLALSIPLIPIWENYTNANLIKAMGCAEQNGHDFGWQFGNYQLRGAEAISEELTPDEEPLPDPFFPPAMEPGAIFFGGTDPGRFIPTYMIYGANVRPDVFLITQNALADPTYMSVERDLYGDKIWIPSRDESSECFRQYLEEVQMGKRQANGAVTYVNGKAQVSGALGVMEINALLSKEMFDKNKKNHAFYIEESYAIEWMYPYLNPHGLIMEIRGNEAPISKERITQDRDFWDWYTRRLTGNKAFGRDFAAQKSFSKLRASIAGLYARTGHGTEADIAYRDALKLYPLSPESIFRYAQDVLLTERRFDEIYDLIGKYDEEDPNNQRSEKFLELTSTLEKAYAVIEKTIPLIREKQATTLDVINLTEAYFTLNQVAIAESYWKQIANAPDITLKQLISGADKLCSAGRMATAFTLISRIPQIQYPQIPLQQLVIFANTARINRNLKMASELLYYAIKADKNLWQAMLTQALVYADMGDDRNAAESLKLALKIGKEEAAETISTTGELLTLFRKYFK